MAEEKKKRGIGLPIAGGVAAAGIVAQRLHPISRATQQVQKVAGVPRTGALPILPLRGRVGGAAPSRYLPILTQRNLKRRHREHLSARRLIAHEVAHQTKLGQRGFRQHVKRVTRPIVLSVKALVQGRSKLAEKIIGRALTQQSKMLSNVKRVGHKPEHRVAWRHVEKLMKRKGLWKKLRRLGYAMDYKMLEITCKKCGKVFHRKAPLNRPLRCPSCHLLLKESNMRKQKYGLFSMPKEGWSFDDVEAILQRGDLKGKRGQRELEAIIDNPYSLRQARKWHMPIPRGVGLRRYKQALKKRDLQGAIRIRRETYPDLPQKTLHDSFTRHELNMIEKGTLKLKARKMSKQKYASTLESKILKGAGRFAKRHWGLFAAAASVPIIANEVQDLLQQIEEKRAAENYAFGRRQTVRKLVSRAQRRKKLRRVVTRFPRRHPKLGLAVGAAGLGGVAGARLQRRTESSSYALPTKTQFLQGARTVGGKIGRGAKIAVRSKPAKVAGTVVLSSLISWITHSILEELERKRIPAIGPYMPDVRADIELRPRYCINQVVEYAADIPNLQLFALKGKVTQTLSTLKALPGKAKASAQRSMLAWLLGFITAELVGRGITTPKRRVRVEGEVPIRTQRDYAVELDDMRRANVRFDAQTKRVIKTAKKMKREARFAGVKRLTRGRSRRALGAVLPVTAIAALVARRRREDYLKPIGHYPRRIIRKSRLWLAGRPLDAMSKLVSNEMAQAANVVRRRGLPGGAKKLRMKQRAFRTAAHKRLAEGRKMIVGAGVVPPIVGTAATVALTKQKKQDYFKAAAVKVAAKKVGKWTKKWGGRAFTGLIIGDVAASLVPKKKKLPTAALRGPGYQTPQPYALAGARHVRSVIVFLRKNLTAWEDVLTKSRSVAKRSHAQKQVSRFRREIATLQGIAGGERRANIGAAAIGAGAATIPAYLTGKKLEKKRIQKAIEGV